MLSQPVFERTEVNQHLHDELTYEQQIRGIPLPSTVKEERTTYNYHYKKLSFLHSIDEITSCTAILDLHGYIQNYSE